MESKRLKLVKGNELFWYYPEGDAYVIKDLSNIPSIDKANTVEYLNGPGGGPSTTEVHIEGVKPYTVEEYHEKFCQRIRNIWVYCGEQ